MGEYCILNNLPHPPERESYVIWEKNGKEGDKKG
jgi:hypothetical protein